MNIYAPRIHSIKSFLFVSLLLLSGTLIFGAFSPKEAAETSPPEAAAPPQVSGGSPKRHNQSQNLRSTASSGPW